MFIFLGSFSFGQAQAQNTTQPSMFGNTQSTQQPQNSGFGFGQQKTGGLFGAATTTQPTTNLFVNIY